MTTTNSPAGETAERELVITRIFDAPRELVWKAWTDPWNVLDGMLTATSSRKS